MTQKEYPVTGKIFRILILCMLIVTSLYTSVFAAEPDEIITNRYTVSTEETWTRDHNITGMVANYNNNKLTLKGSTLTTNSSFQAGIGNYYAFGNWGNLTLDSVTINNQPGEHRIVNVNKDGVLNVINNTKINFGTSTSTTSGEAMFKVIEGRTANFSDVTMTGNGSNNYGQGTYFDVASGASVNFSGKNTLDKLNGIIRVSGNFAVKNSAAEDSESDVTTISNSNVRLYGTIVIDEGATLVISKTYLQMYSGAQFIVKKGGTLKINDGSTLYLYTNGYSKNAVVVDEGGTFIMDGSTISYPYISAVKADGGTVTLTDVTASSAMSYNTGGGIVNAVNGSKVTVIGGSYTYCYAADRGGVFYVKNSELAISGGTYSYNYISGGNDRQGGVIYLNGGSLTINGENATYSNNSAIDGGVIFAEGECEINITGGTFTGNAVSNFGGVLYTKNSDAEPQYRAKDGTDPETTGAKPAVTISGGTYENNTAKAGGAMRVMNSSLTIKDDSQFKGNTATNEADSTWVDWVGGGAIFATAADLKIETGTFESNKANLIGGALVLEGGTLELGSEADANKKPVFKTNEADVGSSRFTAARGGAIAADIYCDGTSFDTCNAEAVPVEIIIHNAEFDGNKSRFQAGALAIGYGPYTGYRRRAKSEVNVVIHEGLFQNNEVTKNHNQGMGGGAIMIQENGTLSMKDVLITGNHTNAAGGGIASCATGQTLINESVNHHDMAEGAAVFDNTAGVPGDGLKDIYIFDNSVVHEVGEKMFNGKKHNWTKDENVERIGIRDGQDYPMTGTYYGSAPVDADKPTEAQAKIIFKNNKSTGIFSDPKRTNGNGGAISNNGLLVIGTYDSEIEITKIWQDDSNAQGLRPDPKTLLHSLILTAEDQGQIHQTQKINDVENAVCPEGTDRNVSCYTAVWEPYNLDIQVTGYVAGSAGTDEPGTTGVNEDEWTIKVIGLPQNMFDNDLGRVVSVTWTLSEEIPTFEDPQGNEYPKYLYDVESFVEDEITHFKITNVLNIVKISGSKVWRYEQGTTVDIPLSITVHLHANGAPIQKKVVTPAAGSSDWTFTFDNLPMVDAQGEPITYTIHEEWVNHWRELDDEDTFVITNVYDPNHRNIDVNKDWIDNDNRDGKRVPVTFELFVGEGEEKTSTGKTLTLGIDEYYGQFKDLDVYCGVDTLCVYTVEEVTAIEDYTRSSEGDADEGYTFYNTYDPHTPPTPPTPPDGPQFFVLDLPELPKTGFSAVRPTALAEQPLSLRYALSGMTLEIPSLDVSANIVEVPYADNGYAIDWLDNQAGLLEGSAKPGEGISILTGHNHLNTMEAGPFAFLKFLGEGDMIFVRDGSGELQSFRVYASEKIGAADMAKLEQIAMQDENSLTLLTCEDELPEGGYASRRVVAARPAGK